MHPEIASKSDYHLTPHLARLAREGPTVERLRSLGIPVSVGHASKHVGDVDKSIDGVRSAIESLTARRDQRRDGFAKAVRQAMQTTLGEEADALYQRTVEILDRETGAIPATSGAPWSLFERSGIALE